MNTNLVTNVLVKFCKSKLDFYKTSSEMFMYRLWDEGVFYFFFVIKKNLVTYMTFGIDILVIWGRQNVDVFTDIIKYKFGKNEKSIKRIYYNL